VAEQLRRRHGDLRPEHDRRRRRRVAPGIEQQQVFGTFDVLSTMLDYHPVKRVDIYGGVSYSVAAGGLANGFQKSVDIAPTAGIRASW
jgi:hypothetical protein